MIWWSRLFAPRRPGRDAFARLMIDALRRAGQDGSIDYDAEGFKLKMTAAPGAGTDTFYLDNAYNDYVHAAGRRERAEVMRRYAGLRPSGSEPVSYELARPNLLPRVQGRHYHESMKLNLRLEGIGDRDSVPTRPFTPDLVIDLVFDHPDKLQLISAKQLDEWNVTFDEVVKVATDNLWSRSNENFNVLQPGLHLGPWEDAQAASRLFLHGLIWQLPVKGRHVAMVPSRGVLLVTGSEDEEGLLRMAELADQVLQEPRRMSGVALSLSDDNRWTPFLPPPDHPAHWPLRRTAIRSTAMDYEEQRELLNAIDARDGNDVFNAKLDVVRDVADDRWQTWTTWTDAVDDTLLPRADIVALDRSSAEPNGEEPVRWADWDDVVRVAGDLLEPTDHYPPRYRVRAFPSPEQLEAMVTREAL